MSQSTKRQKVQSISRERYLIINSKDRDTSSSSSVDYTYTFPQVIKGVTGLECVSANIPNTWYNVHSGNQTLKFKEPAGTNTTITLTLTHGSYSASALASYLSTAMTTASTGGVTYTVTYDTKTFKFTISGTANFILECSLWTTALQKLLGFGSTDTSSATTATGGNAAVLYGPSYLFIKIEEMPSPVQITTTYDGKNTGATFVVPVRQNAGDVITFDKMASYGIFQAENGFHFQKISIKLLSSLDNSTYPLNNHDWSFMLLVYHNDD